MAPFIHALLIGRHVVDMSGLQIPTQLFLWCRVQSLSLISWTMLNHSSTDLFLCYSGNTFSINFQYQFKCNPPWFVIIFLIEFNKHSSDIQFLFILESGSMIFWFIVSIPEPSCSSFLQIWAWYWTLEPLSKCIQLNSQRKISHVEYGQQTNLDNTDKESCRYSHSKHLFICSL